MKNLTCSIIILLSGFWSLSSFAQNQSKLYPVSELQEDFDQLTHLITAVHVNPYTELSQQQYEKLLSAIRASLTDSLTATGFLTRIKPLIACLSDEHAQINLKPALLTDAYRTQAIYPPFSLTRLGTNYGIDQCLTNSQLNGLMVKRVNGEPIDKLIKRCAFAATGFPAQRTETALRQFGYLYPWTNSGQHTQFTIETTGGKKVVLAGATLKEWDAFNANRLGATECEERLSYRIIKGTGYINACSFDLKPSGRYSFDSVKAKIDTIFKQIKADGVNTLVIDISRNQGGNSLVGDYLISNIYSKPYKGYRTDWKRSNEYLALLKSWGIKKPDYAAEPVGKVISYPSDVIVPAVTPYPFKGRTVLLVGKNTFSSAMNFATLVKDNRMAMLIGQVPVNGHPSGFGEMFYTNLPHTQVFVRFGVKQYIRPAGKLNNNNLMPDKLLTDTQMNNIENLLSQNKL